MGIGSSTKNGEDITIANGQDIKQIVIEAETWKRDSHGLFDYETNDVIRKTLRIAGTAQIFRETDDLQLLEFSYRKFLVKTRQLFDDSREGDLLSNTDREDLEELKEMPNEMIKSINQNTLGKVDTTEASREPIVQIVYKEGQYWIYNKPFYSKSDDFISNPENQIWYTIRDYRNSASSLGYKLKRGDILKFGRARLRIIEINLGDDSSIQDSRINSDDFSVTSDLPQGFLPKEEDLTDSPTGRIGFGENDEDNPLISPGKGSGSLKFIHYKCLKSWLESKRQIKNTETTVSYHWKSLEGELCKMVFPELAKTKFSLVSFYKPEKNYLILESISATSAKSVYVVDLESRNDVFRIGRGHDSDIRVSDISVSRFHALIVKTEENELIIKDNNSKFGTLICLQHPLLLSEYDRIHLQVGRTLFEIQTKEKKDWTLKGGLWVKQENASEEQVKTSNYLGKFGYTDSFLPEEFKLFWNRLRKDSIHSSLQNS